MDEAISFAMENNKNSKNASKDILISQKEKWETIAIGLPQITSFFEFNNRIKDPISLIPAEFFGGKKGEFAEISFGTKQSISGELILNQLLFDGSYVVGLQSIKLFLEIADQAKIKTDIEVKRQVINAYGNAIVSSERVKILERNYKNHRQLDSKEQTKIMMLSDDLFLTLDLLSPEKTHKIFGLRPVLLATFSGLQHRPKYQKELYTQLFMFTPVEHKICEQLLEGKTTKEIALSHEIQLDTVKKHLKSIFKKTKTNRQAGLIQLLMQQLFVLPLLSS